MPSKTFLLDALKEAQRRNTTYYTQGTGPGLSRYLRRMRKLGWKYVVQNLARFSFVPQMQIRVKTCWGETMRLPLGDYDTAALWYFGTLPPHETRLAQYLLNTLRPTDVFYDIGANHGFFSLVASHALTQGEIHAFEPAPVTRGILKQNVEQLSHVHVHALAVTDMEGTIRFYDKTASGHSGGSTIVSAVQKEEQHRFEHTQVPAVCLDAFAQEHRPPNVIKMDIEGAEERALRGAKHLLKMHKPTVVMEVNVCTQAWAQASLRAMHVLYDLGYEAFSITNEGALRAYPKPTVLTVRSGALDNLVFRHPEVAETEIH